MINVLKRYYFNEIVIFFYLNLFFLQLPFFKIEYKVAFNYILLGLLFIINIKGIKLNDLVSLFKNNFFIVVIFNMYLISLIQTEDIVNGTQHFIASSTIISLFFILIYKKIDSFYIKSILFHSYFIGFVYLFFTLFFSQFNIYRNPISKVLVNFLGTSSIPIIIGLYVMLIISSFSFLNKRKIGYFILIFIPIAFYILFETQTRVGIYIVFSYCFFIIFFELISFRKIKKIIYILLLLILFLIIVYYGFIYLYKYTDFINYIVSKGSSGRLLMLGLMIEDLHNNSSFLFGMGIGTTEKYLPNKFLFDFPSKDNSSLFIILYEFGIIGITVWTLFILTYIWKLVLIYKKEPSTIKYFFTIPLVFILLPSNAVLFQYSLLESSITYFIIAATFKYHGELKRKTNGSYYD